tara:strand:+ start:71 stop:235 length:165 start_codon:yes stop_codon:yes gene_type:complete
MYGSFYRGPISLLEPLVVLIGRHKDMLVKDLKRELGEGERWFDGGASDGARRIA